MKTKWELIYNPFIKIAGWKAFVIGAVIVCATVITGYWNDVYFTGIQMKMSEHLTLWVCFLIQAIALLSTVILMYVTSLFFAKQVRFQDILGTVTLSRYPYLFIALLMFYIGPRMQSILEKITEVSFSTIEKLNIVISISDYIVLLIFAVLALIIIIWNIALLYNAFKVSTGIKGYKTAILLTGIIIASEIITFIISVCPKTLSFYR
jgi:hypothetical protein